MNLIIIRKNGEQISLIDAGIKTRDFVIDSPSPRHEADVIEGRDGAIDLGTTFEPRSMRGSFLFESDDALDYVSKRNAVFKIFAAKEAFYLIDERENEKRWLVKSGGFSPEQAIKYGFFGVEFGAFSAYSESIKTTIELPVVQISGDNVIKYVHNSATFEILNDGDITINPREMPLLISYNGTSNNLTIKNLTTGDEWSYTGTSNPGDVIRLDGIRSTKNSLSIFRDTNHKLITLAPGWNEFEIMGATDPFEISFDFRFYTI